MQKAEIYHSGDYAGIRSKNFSAYYGYEITDENDNWCFECTFESKDGKQVINIPFPKLKIKDQFNCEEGLLKGIAWIFEKYHLEL